jgi:hypothetical protein
MPQSLFFPKMGNPTNATNNATKKSLWHRLKSNTVNGFKVFTASNATKLFLNIKYRLGRKSIERDA